jgi:multidrug/hemolysin transport system permease protein
MRTIIILIKRNVKLFFKDKGMFFTALITPAILLVLYATFLGNVYRDSFVSSLPENIQLSEGLIDGLVGAQLISSILAVSCVTVAFCSNFLMVQDKANGTLKDLTVSPIRPSTLSMSYYLSTLISTLIICFVAMGLCLIYVGAVGWYMSGVDVLLLSLDIVLLVLFGTALSSVINFFLSSQGQISAVGTVVSSGYGFICGAYMPINSFGKGLQRLISFLPGTYGTSLVRTHSMRGVLDAMHEEGIPADIIEQIRKVLDCNVYFFEKKVSVPIMYAVLGGAVFLLILIYVFMNVIKLKKAIKR